jgi:hypothetical protein
MSYSLSHQPNPVSGIGFQALFPFHGLYPYLSLQLKTELQIYLPLTFLQRNSFVQIVSFHETATFTSSYPLRLSTWSNPEFQLIPSASCSTSLETPISLANQTRGSYTSLETPIFSSNQTRGRLLCFSTVDWPMIWGFSAVQTENMSEQTKPDAQITASPVPP